MNNKMESEMETGFNRGYTVVSLNRGTLVQTSRYYNPYYGDPPNPWLMYASPQGCEDGLCRSISVPSREVF